jgi:hypothetical protein
MCTIFIALLSGDVAAVQNSEQNDDKPQADQPETTTKVKKFRIGVSYLNGFPLFEFSSQQDKGFGWAILEAFAKEHNIEFEYIPMPITRLQPSMDNDAIDFIFPDSPLWTSYRSNRFPNIYSAPIFSAVSASFTSGTNPDILPRDVSKVAIPFGYTAYTWVGPINDYDIKTIPVRDLAAGLRAVRLGTAEAADVEYNIGRYIISKDPMLANVTVGVNLPNTPVNYHLSSIKHIVVLEKLSEFVKNNQDLIEELKQQYKIVYHDEVFVSGEE